jgi:hypothetical protein
MVIAQSVPQVHDHAWTFGEVPVIGCTPSVLRQYGHDSPVPVVVLTGRVSIGIACSLRHFGWYLVGTDRPPGSTMEAGLTGAASAQPGDRSESLRWRSCTGVVAGDCVRAHCWHFFPHDVSRKGVTIISECPRCALYTPVGWVVVVVNGVVAPVQHT